MITITLFIRRLYLDSTFYQTPKARIIRHADFLIIKFSVSLFHYNRYCHLNSHVHCCFFNCRILAETLMTTSLRNQTPILLRMWKMKEDPRLLVNKSCFFSQIILRCVVSVVNSIATAVDKLCTVGYDQAILYQLWKCYLNFCFYGFI